MENKKIIQINNLKIKYNKLYNKYQVITPDKRVLEEFEDIEQAKDFARKIKDYKKKQLKEKYTYNIEKLCDKVNKKYNLKHNDIGSIEHYQDMCENSIIQIKNEYRGTIQLAYGDDKTLKNYLLGILEDRIKLKV